MPQETQAPQSSISQSLGKHSRNWKKILLILLILGISVSLIGVGLYLLIPRLIEEPTSSTQKQVTPPAKIKPKTTKIVWIKGKEIWVKELNKKAEKVLTEDKKILDWDLLGNQKIVYITAVEKSKDKIYGTEIVSLDLKTKKREVLYEKDLEANEFNSVKNPGLNCKSCRRTIIVRHLLNTLLSDIPYPRKRTLNR